MNKNIKNFIIITLLSFSALQGCSSGLGKQEEQKARQFMEPTDGKSGIYIYRDSGLFGILRDVNIIFDNTNVGELENASFLYFLTNPGTHTIMSSQGDLLKIHKMLTGHDYETSLTRIKTKPNTNYFIEFKYLQGKFKVKEKNDAIEIINDCDYLPAIKEDLRIAHNPYPLHHYHYDLHKINETYALDNNLSITVNDQRVFNDTGVIDPYQYYIDENQEDNAENRAKTIGYVITSFTQLSNLVVDEKVTDIVTNALLYAVEKKQQTNKEITANITDLWVSPTSAPSATTMLGNKITYIIDSLGYRYEVEIKIKDKLSGEENNIICADKSAKEGLMSINENEIMTMTKNMLTQLNTCLQENII